MLLMEKTQLLLHIQGDIVFDPLAYLPFSLSRMSSSQGLLKEVRKMIMESDISKMADQEPPSLCFLVSSCRHQKINQKIG